MSTVKKPSPKKQIQNMLSTNREARDALETQIQTIEEEMKKQGVLLEDNQRLESILDALKTQYFTLLAINSRQNSLKFSSLMVEIYLKDLPPEPKTETPPTPPAEKKN